MFGKALWTKLAIVAVSGGTALALFGGAAVHTQFSATSNQTVTAEGASVALTVDSGSLTCTNLLPGGPLCTTGFTIWNKGTVPENFSITFGTIIVNNGGVNGDVLANLDQAGLYLTNGAGVVFGTGSPYASPSNAVGVPLSTLFNNDGTPKAPAAGLSSLAPGLGNDGTLGVSLESGTLCTGTCDPNAWNGASITIPYTITATAGS